jgi:LmbE family N-acetylglucosaminyl deacetylase
VTLPSGRTVVLSPHCDDGVFGCGELLASRPGAVVVTAFAGRPPAYDGVTPWDAAAGFGPGDDPVAARRAEDRDALALLAAIPRWLDFCDSQYHRSPGVDELTDALDAVLTAERAAIVAAPLGLFHSDHALVHEAALRLARALPDVTWLAYEDAIYRRLDGLLPARLDALRRRGFDVARVTLPRAPDAARRKRDAVLRYRSQLRALALPGHPGYDDAFAPDGYWRVA